MTRSKFKTDRTALPLKLYKPITPFDVTQAFAEDLTCVDTATKNTSFLTRESGKACPVGFESLYKCQGLAGHDGLDIRASRGQAIYAACEGIVEKIQTQEMRGLGIEIVSEQRYLFENETEPYFAKTKYWHLLSFNVKEGDRVSISQLIGWADNTGASSGDHLHFELRIVDKTKKARFSRDVRPDNGYKGAVDPAPYFQDLSAFDRNSLATRLRYRVADLLNRSRITG